jgi:hypothetical protein
MLGYPAQRLIGRLPANLGGSARLRGNPVSRFNATAASTANNTRRVSLQVDQYGNVIRS